VQVRGYFCLRPIALCPNRVPIPLKWRLERFTREGPPRNGHEHESDVRRWKLIGDSTRFRSLAVPVARERQTDAGDIRQQGWTVDSKQAERAVRNREPAAAAPGTAVSSGRTFGTVLDEWLSNGRTIRGQRWAPVTASTNRGMVEWTAAGLSDNSETHSASLSRWRAIG
jgi:hypothetical protein